MNDEIRDLIGRLALLMFRIEYSRIDWMREQYVHEMNVSAAKLNDLCNRPNRETSHVVGYQESTGDKSKAPAVQSDKPSDFSKPNTPVEDRTNAIL